MRKELDVWTTTGFEDMCEFIRGLSEERLDWLIVDPILGSDVLKHAVTCEACSARIEELIARDFATLTAEERQSCETPAKGGLYVEMLELLHDKQWRDESRRDFALAASTVRDNRPSDEVPSLSASIGNVQVSFQEDAVGSVFVRGAPPSATMLLLGDRRYELRSAASQDLYEVHKLGLIELIEWLEKNRGKQETRSAFLIPDQTGML